ncbi:transcription elongation factor B polypeptide 3-like [Chrysoperla carnea]|uniref:transcription elongation factor B polypeptide 3-like n=1 Tax=Chrysoperla carnea TaxID=189513 RepID=UPI001D08A7D6|nr:transcription elongation factor B polypeptide 3-like [Chrysoperla carnea]
MSVVDVIKHYQRSIEKYTNDEKRILYCIGKLEKLPIKVNDLQDTGVGRTINSLRKYEGAVGHAARTLVAKWKEMVAAESSHSEAEAEPEPEPEPDVDSDVDQIVIDEHGYDNDNDDYNNDNNDEYVPTTNNYQQEQHKKQKHNDNDNDNEYKPTSIIKDDHEHHKSDKSKHHRSSSSKHNDNDNDESDNKKKSSSSSSSSKRKTTTKLDRHDNSNSHTNDEHKHNKHKKKSHKNDKDKDKEHKILNNMNDNELSDNDNDLNQMINDNDSDHYNDNDGINFTSGKSFADALGGHDDMLTVLTSSPTKKKIKLLNNGTTSTTSTSNTSCHSPKLKSSTSSKSHQNKSSKNDNNNKTTTTTTPDLLSPNIKLPSLNLDITLPPITPNYQPLPTTQQQQVLPLNKHNNMNNSTIDLSFVITSQKNRTKVYSGNKNTTLFTQVPTLYELCIRILQDNIDALAYTGGVPYMILLPILERCTPDQLFVLEHYNAYLLEDTDPLWEQHCKTHFKAQMCKREEFESWRDAYQRFMIERDHKLKLLTQNIKQSIHEKLQPIRQTKLAYVDTNFIKPPRSIARKQAKYGTASSTGNTNFNAKPFVTPASRVAAVNSSTSSSSSTALINNRSTSASGASSSMSSSKPKKAPLMQKTLALIKSTNRYRR